MAFNDYSHSLSHTLFVLFKKWLKPKSPQIPILDEIELVVATMKSFKHHVETSVEQKCTRTKCRWYYNDLRTNCNMQHHQQRHHHHQHSQPSTTGILFQIKLMPSSNANMLQAGYHYDQFWCNTSNKPHEYSCMPQCVNISLPGLLLLLIL